MCRWLVGLDIFKLITTNATSNIDIKLVIVLSKLQERTHAYCSDVPLSFIKVKLEISRLRLYQTMTREAEIEKEEKTTKDRLLVDRAVR